MQLPDEAIEAAAKALDPYVMGVPGSASEKFKDATRAEARRAIEAAAPIIAAQAWGEGVVAGMHASEFYSIPRNPYREARSV